MAVGTYVSIYKTDRNKLLEMFTFENITAGALLDSIFYYGHDNILDEVCFVKYSSLSVLCDFFKNNNLQYEYEDTIELTKDIYESIKYSLQGTTQGRYLTGGVPPIRFSM